MLYEFALTAGVFDQFPREIEGITSQALVQVLYGVRRNGLIADLYAGDWRVHVMKKFNAMPTKIRPLVQSLFTQLHDRGLIVPRPQESKQMPKK